MTEFDFKLLYTKLCINYGKNMNTDITQARGDMLYDKYRAVDTETFKKTIELVMERHGAEYGFFPGIKEISKCMSEVIGGDGGKSYAFCPVCNRDHSGIGAVSMIIVFEEPDYSSGKTKRVIKERHVWTFELSRTINQPRAYDFNVCCRCEAGRALLRAREGKCYQLTEEEFNGLLAEDKPKHGEQKEIPF